MKHKSMSQMNKEKKRKPMTVEEEYRNADVPMPEDPKDLKEIIRRLEQQNQELRKQTYFLYLRY